MSTVSNQSLTKGVQWNRTRRAIAIEEGAVLINKGGQESNSVYISVSIYVRKESILPTSVFDNCMNFFKTRFDFTTFHFFLCFLLHPAIRHKMNNQTENVAYQLFSRRRYFVHRILTNHSEDHDKLIISWANVF